MPAAVPALLAWAGVAVHAVALVLVRRRGHTGTAIAWVNLATSLAVLAYWVPRWYGVLTRGTLWYLSDQALPCYAALVALLCTLTLAGRVQAGAAHWLAFGLHAIVLFAAALFLTFFRLNRLF